MLKAHKNEIHKIISEVANLDPNRFTLVDKDDAGFPVSQISTIDLKMSFWFRNRPHSWEVFDYKQTKFSPDFSVASWLPQNGQTFNFQQVSEIFTKWLNTQVKPFFEELDSVDKWNSFQFETDIFHLLQEDIADNSNFSIEETSKISKSIDNLRQLIIDKFDPVEERLKFIDERLNYLSESTSRLGKFDWKGQFVSTMISIAINMMFDKETGNAFFKLIKEAFSGVKSIISG